MNLTGKKVLIIDLDRNTCNVNNFTDLNRYIGGVSLGLKLLQTYYEQEPIVISIGPLNGFFPFASKTSIVLTDGIVVEDLYIGGSLSTRLKFTGLDSIVILGKAKEETIIDINNTECVLKSGDTDLGSLGLPGKRSVIEMKDTKAILDNWFSTPEYILEEKLKQKNIKGLVITGSEVYKAKDNARYLQLYDQILKRKDDLTVGESIQPSCSNCPMGCEKAKLGEIGGNVLVHSLVGCQFAEKIYSDIGVIFSCLNALGYEYTHEDIENLPKLVEETLKFLS